MRTVIYVDGFNLYFRALKGQSYSCKWLDIQAACKALPSAENDVVGMKYFTARVSSTARDPDKSIHQQLYIRALRQVTPNLEVIYWQFATHPVEKSLVTPILDAKGSTIKRAIIYETKEKGSDVNLAVHMLNDAWRNQYDCAVLVSGDSDLAEAVRLIKAHHKKKVVGVISASKSGMSKELVKECNFIRALSPTLIAHSQMPDPVPNSNIRKPAGW